MLQRLPKDVLVLVIEQVAYKRDLKALCGVSKALYDFVIPKLYETIVLQAKDERHLERLNVGLFLGTKTNPKTRLQHVRNIHFASHFHENLKKRCIHNADDNNKMERDVDETPEDQTSFYLLTNKAMGVLQRLGNGSLRSFSWEMGTCIPDEILGSSGYLKRKQRCIESISLITSGECHYNVNSQNIVDLSAFHHLRKISWIGLRSDDDFDATVAQVTLSINN